jgi:hypothetical protein
MNSWGDDLLNKMKLTTKIKIESFKHNFKRRTKIIALWSLGVITGIAFCYAYLNWHILTDERTVVITVAHADEVVPVVEVVVPKKTNAEIVEAIATDIYNKESSSGKNNYSKCEAKGKVNNLGFGIPGGGTYQCFDSHEDEMVALKGWIMDKLSKGYTPNMAKCGYNTGKFTESCGYIDKG